MLLSLNDDCLRTIGELLVLEDQLSLAHVCVRLQYIVEDIWHHNSTKVTLTREHCRKFNKNVSYFYEYMRCITDNVVELEMDHLRSSSLHALHELNFPKLKSLTISMHYGGINAEQDIKLMVKLFPHLTKLEFCSGTTGKNLCEFQNLEELHLICCERLRTKNLKKIMTRLRLKKLSLIYYCYNTCLDSRIDTITDCPTLEELFIDDHHLIMIKDDLHKLKKLWKIMSYTCDYDTLLLDHISTRYGKVMETMIFKDIFWTNDDHCEHVKRMVNLKRLILSEEDITDEQLHKIGKSIGKQLEEFHFVNALAEVKNEEGFLDLISQCLNLKLFQVSNTLIDISFVRRVAELISSQMGKRKVPLLLRCDDTKITNDDLELLPLPPLLQVTLSKLESEQLLHNCFQCEWRVDND